MTNRSTYPPVGGCDCGGAGIGADAGGGVGAGSYRLFPI
jgi:hypothetical protein